MYVSHYAKATILSIQSVGLGLASKTKVNVLILKCVCICIVFPHSSKLWWVFFYLVSLELGKC